MTAIRLAAATNVRAFNTLIASYSGPTSDHEALQDELGRFRVWCGNIGALQKGHSSLDYRLRDSPLLSSNAIKLLQELEENLTSAFAIVSGARLPYEQQAKTENTEQDEEDDFFSEDEDENSDPGAPKTELEMRFREISDIVSHLYKLSVRIRAPTARSRSLKAASFRPKDPESGVDILDQYAAFDLKHVRELVKHLKVSHMPVGDVYDDDGLVTRLAQAVTLRRQQFKYWRRHRDKLGMPAVHEEPEVQQTLERPGAPQRHDTLEAQLTVPIVTTTKEAPSQKTGKTLLSGTEATHHHQSLDDIVDAKSVTSYATTVRDITGKGIDLPPPPKNADGERDFECPFCFIICPARYGNGRPWRTHVLQDLQPYICTYAECDLPTQLFRSRREWAEHEASHRKAWRCPEHPTAVYGTQNGLREHLQQNHADSFPESQLDSIVRIGETSTVDMRQTCPICSAPADMEGLGGMQNHIANHLERIATFALPKNVDDESDGVSSIASRGETNSNGSQDLSDVSFVSGSSNDEDQAIESSTELGMSTQYSTHSLPSAVAGTAEPLQGQGLLSEELLRDLPDVSQKRLDILLESQQSQEIDEYEPVETPKEVDEHIEEMETFRNYLMSLPQAQSVRFYRRYGAWKGHVTFKDDSSASAALGLFNRKRYPRVIIKQQGENKAALKFNLPAGKKASKTAWRKVQPSAEHAAHAESHSNSSASVSYEEREQEDQTPILTVSEIPTLRSLYHTSRLLQRDQSYAPNVTYNQIISFCFHDITRLKVDAIVNSANRSLRIAKTNTTLNHVVHKAAGPMLKSECKGIGKIKPGQAALTAGWDLPASHIIHVARPTYSGNKGMGQYNQLSECYRSALRLAENRELKTVAFCSLGAGGCGFPPRVAARIALQEVREFLDNHQSHKFERIIFCVYTEIDERAYMHLLPVFFPPTHGDLENAIPHALDPKRAAVLGSQVLDALAQVEAVTQDLYDFDDDVPEFPQHVLDELSRIASAFRNIKNTLLDPKETVKNIDEQTASDCDLICTVMLAVCGSATEIIELAKAKANLGQPSNKAIWDDYNAHMKSSQGLNVIELLEMCSEFVWNIENVFVRNGERPYEMTTLSIRLGSWHLKQTGKGENRVRDHFEEVLYTREFQRDAANTSRNEVVMLHQVPALARLYQIGELEQKLTNAIPSTQLNYIVSFIREDITKLEVDVLVNSTDPGFSGMGTLDRTVFRKGGPEMEDYCANFGMCNEGDVKLSGGYMLPAKHVLHAIPPETYRSTSKDVLRKIYREILVTASSLKATSIAIPSIGTGMLNYPRHDSASLAIEEVKRFLETMDSSNPIEKVVFVVYGSSDEWIYKALLPLYFPPLDLNVNKALPASKPEASQPVDIADTGETPRRSIFGSFGDAFRSVKFGKQSVKLKERSLQSGEEDALIAFEKHGQGCSTCSDIRKVYTEGGYLCADGYRKAQMILRYLYMERDHTVYSTSLSAQKRVKVKIPTDYPLCLDLLTTVEKSFRDTGRSRPFVSPNLPWQGRARLGQDEEAPPPGVTIHNAEITIPIQSERAEVVARVHTKSNESSEWEPVEAEVCSLQIEQNRLMAFEWEDQDQKQDQLPAFSLELTPLLVISKNTSSTVGIDKIQTFEELSMRPASSILLTFLSPADCELLFQRLTHAARTNPTFKGQSVQSLETKMAGDSRSTFPGLPSSSAQEQPTGLHTYQETTDLQHRIGALAAASRSLRPRSTDNLPGTEDADLSVLRRRVLAHLKSLPWSHTSRSKEQLAAELNASSDDITSAVEQLEALRLIHQVLGENDTWMANRSRHNTSPDSATRRTYREPTDPMREEQLEPSDSEPNLSPELPPSGDVDTLLSGLSTIDLSTQLGERSGSHDQPSASGRDY